jgi:uncharacterized protein YjbI with pentapeptide repeats
MANEEHVRRLLKEGVKAWNAWREAELDVTPDLTSANLSGADLSSANLSGANLSGADLTSAQINRQTNFEGVIVSGRTQGVGPWIFNPDQYIIREIEFPPEYRQAGIGIMHYFAEVMRDKYQISQQLYRSLKKS